MTKVANVCVKYQTHFGAVLTKTNPKTCCNPLKLHRHKNVVLQDVLLCD